MRSQYHLAPEIFFQFILAIDANSYEQKCTDSQMFYQSLKTNELIS